jgi:site-specific DNA-cytosine methylase
MPGNGGAVLHVGATVVFNRKHAPLGPDEPATTIRGGGQGHSAPAVVIASHPRHPESDVDSPSRTIKTNGGRAAQGGAVLLASRAPDPNRQPTSPEAVHRTITTQSRETAVLQWPWDRPATTIQGDERLSAAGHHDPKVSNSQHGPNAIILSERAAAILQGFPESWTFAGATKRARWSQLGQAMPPPLAEAVARSVVAQRVAAQREAA